MNEVFENHLNNKLIAQAGWGDKAALERLIGLYLKKVYNWCYFYVKDRQDAEDLTQAVFIKVWRHLKKFDQTKAFGPWLFKISKNASLDFLKKKSTVPFSVMGKDNLDYQPWGLAIDQRPRPDEATEKNLATGRLRQALAKLSPKSAQAVWLYHQKGLNFREISQTTKESINTVKSRYRRALALLRKIMGRA